MGLHSCLDTQVSLQATANGNICTEIKKSALSNMNWGEAKFRSETEKLTVRRL